jgi:serine/threonine-protein kinase
LAARNACSSVLGDTDILVHVGDESSVTIQDSPASEAGSGARPASETGTPLSGTLPLPSPETVLHRAEVEQARRTAIAGVVFNTLGLAGLPLLGGDPRARAICAVSLAGAWVNNAWLLWAAKETRYRERHLVIYFAIAPLWNAGVIYYFGVIGAILVMLVLNLYTACLGYGRRVALITLIGGIAPVVVLGGLMSVGVLSDPGLITAAPRMPAAARGIVVVTLAVFLILVYLQARAARELMVASLHERDDAVRRASHREALFLEARQELERALRAGGLGRFTEQTLGSYRLGAVLGRGGMGEVYEAVHVETNEPAAVKLLLPEALARPEHVRRFMREVRIAASLDSIHVVRVLEIGDESAPLPYLAMERLRGEDLGATLRRDARLKPAAVVDLVRQVGSGLEVAAAAGIVHRDLKPQNVFRNETEPGKPPVWKILDFGVAKLEQHSGTLTVDEIVGTPQYMSPEQAQRTEVDARTDLYALGAIAYRALTGHPPFPGRDLMTVLMAVMTDMPVRPSALVRLPRDVDLVLAIALAKDPSHRFASATELADALESAIAGRLPEPVRKRGAALEATLPWREE